MRRLLRRTLLYIQHTQASVRDDLFLVYTTGLLIMAQNHNSSALSSWIRCFFHTQIMELSEAQRRR